MEPTDILITAEGVQRKRTGVSDDTPGNLTGAKLERALLRAGHSSTHAKRHGRSYDTMLRSASTGTLTEIR